MGFVFMCSMKGVDFSSGKKISNICVYLFCVKVKKTHTSRKSTFPEVQRKTIKMKVFKQSFSI